MLDIDEFIAEAAATGDLIILTKQGQIAAGQISGMNSKDFQLSDYIADAVQIDLAAARELLLRMEAGEDLRAEYAKRSPDNSKTNNSDKISKQLVNNAL